jgi:hypothetical protein
MAFTHDKECIMRHAVQSPGNWITLLLLALLAACGGDDRIAPAISGPASPLPVATVGTMLSTTFAATGTAPLTWTVSAGALPPGVQLNAATGSYSGVPSAAGTYGFTIQASNTKGMDSRAYTQTVLQKPAITAPTTPLAALTAGTAAANAMFTASGSTPIAWSITSGSLPPGMALNAATGAYSGTPSATGNFSFTVTATNDAGSDSKPFTQSVSAPALDAHVLVGGTTLVALPSGFPAGSDAPMTLTGIAVGEVLVGIDRRPQNGMLYGLGYNATAGTVQLYSLSPTTGVATLVGTTGLFVAADGVTVVPVGAGAGTNFGIDFNPAVDRLRVVNSAGQNFRINPNTGAFIDGNATNAGVNMDGAINGATASVQETAYTNNAPSVTLTTQYTLDAGTDALCIQNPPNNGTQTACVALSMPVDAVLGMDIAPGVNATASGMPVSAGNALAVVQLAGQSAQTLVSINLVSGAVAPVGVINGGGVNGLALQQPAAMPIVGLSSDASLLVRFTSAAPATVATVAVTGVAAGETLVGIDIRPQTGQFYALGVSDAADNATLYLLDPQTGAASAVGAAGGIAFVDASAVPVQLPSAATGYGIDFNPTVDRLRVVTHTGLNFRINPNNGVAVDGNATTAGTNTDGAIAGLAAGGTGVSGAAYTNSFGQLLTGGVTTQYVIDAGSDALYIQSPPNNGTVTQVAGLTMAGATVDFTTVSGFDIPAQVRTTASGMPVVAGSAFAALNVGGVTRLVLIDLVNGQVTDLGMIGAALSGLAVGQAVLR